MIEAALESVDDIKAANDLNKIKATNKDAYESLVKEYDGRKDIINQTVTKYQEYLSKGDKY